VVGQVFEVLNFQTALSQFVYSYFLFYANRQRRIGGVATPSRSTKTAETRITYGTLLEPCAFVL